MNKVLKGYELIKEIAEGKIKEGTKFIDKNKEPMKYYPDSNIYRYEHNNLIGRFRACNLLLILNDDFEIIQDESDEIEEIKLKESDKEHLTFGGLIFLDKINELIRKVNEINRKLEGK